MTTLPATPRTSSASLPRLPDTVPHRLLGHRVTVTRPLRLGDGGLEALHAIRFLRECQSHALSVRWHLTPDRPLTGRNSQLPCDAGMLWHLPPPAPPTDGRPEPSGLEEWREQHAYGMFYYRQGPGFVTVKDSRNEAAPARLTIDHPELLRTFSRCQEPMRQADLHATGREAVDLLAGERIVLVSHGWVTALPPRVRHWPVPYSGI